MAHPERLGGYRVLGRIGRGSTADILLADRAGVRVALKVLHPHLHDNVEVWRAFMDEARLNALLTHRGVVRVLDLLESDGDVFSVLELVDGPSLLGLMKLASDRAAPIPASMVAWVIEEVADALAYAHDARDPGTGTPLGIVHRDVAPANILADRRGAVKLTDFGIARSRPAKALGILSSDTTRGGVVKGRRAYVAPEQLLGEPLDARADLYSLGVVAWELLAGRRMYPETNTFDLVEHIVRVPAPAVLAARHDVPGGLAALVDALVTKSRDARPPSAAVVRDQVRALRGASTGSEEAARFVTSLGLPSLLNASAPAEQSV